MSGTAPHHKGQVTGPTRTRTDATAPGSNGDEKNGKVQPPSSKVEEKQDPDYSEDDFTNALDKATKRERPS